MKQFIHSTHGMTYVKDLELPYVWSKKRVLELNLPWFLSSVSS